MINWLSKFRTATKVLSAVVLVVGGFLYSPAGEAVVKQYPHLSAVVGIVGILAALLHVPIKKQS